jgi:hypothetical protein
LLNSEDLLSPSRFDPRRRDYQHARVLLPRSKVTPCSGDSWLRKGMKGAGTAEVIVGSRFQAA